MIISDITEACSGAVTTLQARIQPDGASAPQTLWYRFEGIDAPLGKIADPFVLAMLPSCMMDGETCRIEGAVSRDMRENLDEAQRVLARWYGFLSPVEIDAAEWVDCRQSSGHVASCFSGGVDSWYSLEKNCERITHLMLVRGFDIGLRNDTLWQRARGDLEFVAGKLGMGTILCETNLREVADRGRATWGRPFNGDFWGRCLHGAALGSCAVGLHGTIGELIVPATHSFADIKPWGSSPMLDKYWSNGRVAVRHDGCEANRFDKVRAIAGSDLAMQTLRVCHNDLAQTNCGRCEKCVRTMLALHLCGALEYATTFPDERETFAKLRRLEVSDHLIAHYDVLLREARRAGDRALAPSLEAILGKRLSAERSLAQLVRFLRRAVRRGRTKPRPIVRTHAPAAAGRS